jgi:hypothetical protein
MWRYSIKARLGVLVVRYSILLIFYFIVGLSGLWLFGSCNFNSLMPFMHREGEKWLVDNNGFSSISTCARETVDDMNNNWFVIGILRKISLCKTSKTRVWSLLSLILVSFKSDTLWPTRHMKIGCNRHLIIYSLNATDSYNCRI